MKHGHRLRAEKVRTAAVSTGAAVVVDVMAEAAAAADVAETVTAEAIATVAAMAGVTDKVDGTQPRQNSSLKSADRVEFGKERRNVRSRLSSFLSEFYFLILFFADIDVIESRSDFELIS